MCVPLSQTNWQQVSDKRAPVVAGRSFDWVGELTSKFSRRVDYKLMNLRTAESALGAHYFILCECLCHKQRSQFSTSSSRLVSSREELLKRRIRSDRIWKSAARLPFRSRQVVCLRVSQFFSADRLARPQKTADK